jgi:hypothetical protein
MDKVRNGTRSAAEHLCLTCAHAQIMRGAAESKEVVHCGYVQRRITFPVAECSNYYRRGQTSIGDLYKTAWILETSKNSRSIGFVPYREWRAAHREEEIDECPT